VSPLVYSSSQITKPLLTCGVPYLHFDFKSINVESFDFEVDADGGDMGGTVFGTYVSKKQVCFANGGVPDDCYFGHDIEV